MVSNLAFDDGHPYLEIGADEGVFFQMGERVAVSDIDPPPAIKVTLERSIDGVVWESVAETDDIAAVIDWESWSYGDIQYRATALSEEGAAASSSVVVQARSGALWLSGGVGFSDTARLPFNPEVSITAGRQRALKQYAGRSLPVAYSGEAVSRTVAVSGRLADRDGSTANVEDMVRVAQREQDRFLFRDPDGRRVYGCISDMQLPRQSVAGHASGWQGFWGYGFTLRETEPR